MLLERARPVAADPIGRADIDGLLGLIEMTRGAPADAGRALVRAAIDVAPVDAMRAIHLLNLASVAAAYAGDHRADAAIANLVGDLAPAETPMVRTLTPLLLGLGAHAEGDFAAAASRLRLALERAEELSAEADLEQPMALLFAGRAALYLGDDQASFRVHREAAARARAAGVLGILAQILPRITHAELIAGRWASASANAREGLQLGREIGRPTSSRSRSSCSPSSPPFEGTRRSAGRWPPRASISPPVAGSGSSPTSASGPSRCWSLDWATRRRR
jgi:hypothetical protein